MFFWGGPNILLGFFEQNPIICGVPKFRDPMPNWDAEIGISTCWSRTNESQKTSEHEKLSIG